MEKLGNLLAFVVFFGPLIAVFILVYAHYYSSGFLVGVYASAFYLIFTLQGIFSVGIDAGGFEILTGIILGIPLTVGSFYCMQHALTELKKSGLFKIGLQFFIFPCAAVGILEGVILAVLS